jgi:hypothetical protein
MIEYITNIKGYIMSRMVDYMISLANGRDEVWEEMSETQRERWHFIFDGLGINETPTVEFDKNFPHCKLYTLLDLQVDQAMMVAHYNKETRLKRTVFGMVYSHAVTLLESFIGDSLIALANQHPQVLQGLAAYYDEINKSGKMTLTEIISLPNGIKGKIIYLLQNDTFHNPDTIIKIFHKAIGDFGKGINTTKLRPIISRRHDIIHRNGMTTSGEKLTLELEMVDTDIKIIREFSADLLSRMNSAIIHMPYPSTP